ncbi:MAG: M23 family metallopeptidase [Rheinheimera sp.]|nr:M23 family metallopeptidase [Rheinheimera sp.]
MKTKLHGLPLLLSAMSTFQPVYAATNNAVNVLPDGCELLQQTATDPVNQPQAKVPFPPIALQIQVPVPPQAFLSDGRNYLVYELQLQNFSNQALTLQKIEVQDAQAGPVKAVARYQGDTLNKVLQPAGIDDDEGERSVLHARQGVTAFICVALDANQAIPQKLRHRLVLSSGDVVSVETQVNKQKVATIGAPLQGTDWVPLHGPHVDSHHRKGLWVNAGKVENSRRFAVDWRKLQHGAWHSGNVADLRAYYAYGETVLAVADAVVVLARDLFPDNAPRTPAGFNPAVAITMESIAGNTIVLDIGGGQYVSYAHLQTKSVQVKAGDRVLKGQPIAKIGNSGDSRSPHLHLQVSTDPNHLLFGEGLPFVIDTFRSKKPDQQWMPRANETPWGNDVLIDFGKSRSPE